MQANQKSSSASQGRGATFAPGSARGPYGAFCPGPGIRTAGWISDKLESEAGKAAVNLLLVSSPLLFFVLLAQIRRPR